MKLLSCTHLSKTYINGPVTTTVLHDVDITINKGEFVAIIGPSGSGKSTLMHILGLLDSATSGQYILNGVDVTTMSDEAQARVRSTTIGFVFQSFNLMSRATVLRNVELPLLYARVPRGERQARARKALKAAGLHEEKLFTNLSNQLSGGQMQRVAIARSLINNPSLLLADEPTGNLDQKTGAVVLETFGKLNKEGKTVVLITHDEHVARYADRVISISDGRIVSDIHK